jgi:3-mercaptopyruvate sulfurtransferase SseA
MASIAAKELKDMGYTNVAILESGTEGWKAAGKPAEDFNGQKCFVSDRHDLSNTSCSGNLTRLQGVATMG